MLIFIIKTRYGATDSFHCPQGDMRISCGSPFAICRWLKHCLRQCLAAGESVRRNSGFLDVYPSGHGWSSEQHVGRVTPCYCLIDSSSCSLPAPGVVADRGSR